MVDLLNTIAPTAAPKAVVACEHVDEALGEGDVAGWLNALDATDTPGEPPELPEAEVEDVGLTPLSVIEQRISAWTGITPAFGGEAEAAGIQDAAKAGSEMMPAQSAEAEADQAEANLAVATEAMPADDAALEGDGLTEFRRAEGASVRQESEPAAESTAEAAEAAEAAEVAPSPPSGERAKREPADPSDRLSARQNPSAEAEVGKPENGKTEDLQTPAASTSPETGAERRHPAFSAGPSAADSPMPATREDALPGVATGSMTPEDDLARPAAPRAADHHAAPVARQIGDALVTAREGVVEIALSPEELGRVRMVIGASDRGTVLTVWFDRPDVLDMMRRNPEQLLQDLRASGFGDAQLDLRDGSQDRGESRAGPDQMPAGRTDAVEPPVSTPIAAATPAGPPSATGTRHLDIRL